MRIVTPALVGIILLVLDHGTFVSCQRNGTAANGTAENLNETATGNATMKNATSTPIDSNATDLPEATGSATMIPVKNVTSTPIDSDSTMVPQVPVKNVTSSPSEETTPAQSLVNVDDGETEDGQGTKNVTTMPVDPGNETAAPTSKETPVSLEVDEGASNATELPGVAEEAVGNVTLETDATPAPTKNATGAGVETNKTIAPTTKPATAKPMTAKPTTTTPPAPKPTQAPTVAQVESNITTPPTETSGGEDVNATTDQETNPSIPEGATVCAVEMNNTDATCAELLQFTTATCDCYDFCTGKLTGCLAFGERNSFSCSVETVAGCRATQKVVSAAPQPTLEEEGGPNTTVSEETTEPPLPSETPGGEDVNTTTDQETNPPIPEGATECAIAMSNTDAACAQLLKFTTATCDCYNFCTGKLIACLAFGERNSFSCSGETVAGCVATQKVVSAAPQPMMASLLVVFLGAVLPAMVCV